MFTAPPRLLILHPSVSLTIRQQARQEVINRRMGSAGAQRARAGRCGVRRNGGVVEVEAVIFLRHAPIRFEARRSSAIMLIFEEEGGGSAQW